MTRTVKLHVRGLTAFRVMNDFTGGKLYCGRVEAFFEHSFHSWEYEYVLSAACVMCVADDYTVSKKRIIRYRGSRRAGKYGMANFNLPDADESRIYNDFVHVDRQFQWGIHS